MFTNISKKFLKYIQIFQKFQKNLIKISKIFQKFQKNFKNFQKKFLLAVPDPALLGFDYFPIYYILIIAIPDS